jgi:hypothetical protein
MRKSLLHGIGLIMALEIPAAEHIKKTKMVKKSVFSSHITLLQQAA